MHSLGSVSSLTPTRLKQRLERFQLKKFIRAQKIITEQLHFFEYPFFKTSKASKNKEYLSDLKFKGKSKAYILYNFTWCTRQSIVRGSDFIAYQLLDVE